MLLPTLPPGPLTTASTPTVLVEGTIVNGNLIVAFGRVTVASVVNSMPDCVLTIEPAGIWFAPAGVEVRERHVAGRLRLDVLDAGRGERVARLELERHASAPG